MATSANNNARLSGRARPVRVVVSALRDVRRALTTDGGIAADIAFQNDVNALLAAVARLPPASAQDTSYDATEAATPPVSRVEPGFPDAAAMAGSGSVLRDGLTGSQAPRRAAPRRARHAGRR